MKQWNPPKQKIIPNYSKSVDAFPSRNAQYKRHSTGRHELTTTLFCKLKFSIKVNANFYKNIPFNCWYCLNLDNVIWSWYLPGLFNKRWSSRDHQNYSRKSRFSYFKMYLYRAYIDRGIIISFKFHNKYTRLIYLLTMQFTDDDNLPNYFCTKCSILLDQFKKFKETCLKSYLSLRNTFILDIKVKIRTEIANPTLLIWLVRSPFAEGKRQDWPLCLARRS
jgi:hypothetical protein